MTDFAKRAAEAAEKIDLGFHTNCPNEDEIAIAKDCFIGGANWAAQELAQEQPAALSEYCHTLQREKGQLTAERDALKAEIANWNQLHDNNEACINNQHTEIERLKGLEIDHLADMTRIQDAEREVERLRAALEQAQRIAYDRKSQRRKLELECDEMCDEMRDERDQALQDESEMEHLKLLAENYRANLLKCVGRLEYISSASCAEHSKRGAVTGWWESDQTIKHARAALADGEGK